MLFPKLRFVWLYATKYSSHFKDGYIAESNLDIKVWGFCVFLPNSSHVCVSPNVPVDTNRAVFLFFF